MSRAESDVRHWPVPALGLALTAVGLGAFSFGSYLIHIAGSAEVTDFTVYRSAVATWLAGGDLYAFAVALPDGRMMPFTYPPFAAVLMVPSTWIPLSAGWVISAVLQLGCLLSLAVLLARRTGVLAGLGAPEKATIVAAGWLALVAAEPSLHGIALGQVSLTLIAVVVLDLVAVPPRWRGLLTGLAAAVKLTPGIFLLYLLVTKQWAAAARAALAGLVATAIGFAVMPGPSWHYWTSLLFETSRVGDPAVIRNKSLLGLLAHLGSTGSARTTIWLAVAALVVVVGLWQARRTHAHGAEVAAVITTGLVAAVISPVSWPHHLVWLPLAGLYLAYCRGWRRWLGLAVCLGFMTGTPLLSYGALPPGWAIAGDVVSLVLLVGAVLGVPGRPHGEVAGA